MLAFVLNRHGIPLMPCKPQRARVLLKNSNAKVVSKLPFTIKLNYGTSGYKQPLTAGMDTGSKVIGTAVVNPKGEVVYQAETILRGEEIKSKMETRRMYRKTRRSRKTRYRKPRFLNRKASTKLNRLPPSTRHKIESHLREKKFIESIFPVSKWRLELASFDIHALSNTDVSKTRWWTYQRGEMYGYQNLKQYVLKRDNYDCQLCKKKTKQNVELHVHHILFKSNSGTNTKNNLITLCRPCHDGLHKKKEAQKLSLKLKTKIVNTKHATEVSIVAARIRKYFGDFEETFGFITKIDRMEQGLKKGHFIDAAVIASKGMPVKLLKKTLIRKMVSKGDYQQTKGIRSEKTIPTGKLFGLRKYDQIETTKGTGFVKGKRSSGYFSIGDIHGKAIHNSVKVNTDIIRLSARKITLTAMENFESRHLSTNRLFKEPKILKNVSVIHYTKSDPKKLIEDIESGNFNGCEGSDIGLTIHFGCSGGTLGFGYLKKGNMEKSNQYGDKRIEFIALEAVQVYHDSDGENQIIWDSDFVKDLKVMK